MCWACPLVASSLFHDPLVGGERQQVKTRRCTAPCDLPAPQLLSPPATQPPPQAATLRKHPHPPLGSSTPRPAPHRPAPPPPFPSPPRHCTRLGLKNRLCTPGPLGDGSQERKLCSLCLCSCSASSACCGSRALLSAGSETRTRLSQLTFGRRHREPRRRRSGNGQLQAVACPRKETQGKMSRERAVTGQDTRTM